VKTLARQTRGSLPLRSLLVAGCAVVAVGTLAACGHIPPQAREHASIAGTNASLGDIGIRNAQITLSANGNGVLTVALFNSGSTPDALMAVSSPAATGGTLPSAAGLEIPTTAGVFTSTTKNTILLTGVTTTMIGTTIPVQLAFKGAGTTTIQVPIVDQNYSLNIGPTLSPTSSATVTKGLPPLPTSSATTPAATASPTR